MNETNQNKLEQFFRCYLHENWDEFHPSIEDAVQEFIEHEPKYCIESVLSGLAEIIHQSFDEPQLEVTLDSLGNAYNPAFVGKTYRQWLIEIHNQIAKFLGKSLISSETLIVNNSPSFKEGRSIDKVESKKSSISSPESTSKNTSKEVGEVFTNTGLALLFGVILYPIIGLGGCITRILVQGKPPHPYDQPASDIWLNSPVKSWTTEAIIIPILIVIITFLAGLFKLRQNPILTIILLLGTIAAIYFGISTLGGINFSQWSTNNQSSSYIARDTNNVIRGIVKTKNRSGLYLRKEKDLNSPSIVFAPEGSEVTILYYDNQQTQVNGRVGRWCRARYNGQEGWAWGWYLEVR